ncbi:MAG: glycosyltransferase family 32 protein [Chordicoccus sp.]
MIPKKIHYCWFGHGEKPKLAKRCINSWKKYCPDYEIVEWNETNIDIHANPYMEMCYKNKQYAYLTDYLRLVIVEKYGGIYMDTDVELIHSLNNLLTNEAYIGFETERYVNTGMGFGSVAHGKMVKMMLEEYTPFLDGNHGIVGCPILNTKALLKLGLEQNGSLQVLQNCTIYPKEWFNPYDDPRGILEKTENTVSIHWFAKSWMSRGTIFRSYLTKPLHRIQYFWRTKNKKVNE